MKAKLKLFYLPLLFFLLVLFSNLVNADTYNVFSYCPTGLTCYYNFLGQSDILKINNSYYVAVRTNQSSVLIYKTDFKSVLIKKIYNFDPFWFRLFYYNGFIYLVAPRSGVYKFDLNLNLIANLSFSRWNSGERSIVKINDKIVVGSYISPTFTLDVINLTSLTIKTYKYTVSSASYSTTAYSLTFNPKQRSLVFSYYTYGCFAVIYFDNFTLKKEICVKDWKENNYHVYWGLQLNETLYLVSATGGLYIVNEKGVVIKKLYDTGGIYPVIINITNNSIDLFVGMTLRRIYYDFKNDTFKLIKCFNIEISSFPHFTINTNAKDSIIPLIIYNIIFTNQNGGIDYYYYDFGTCNTTYQYYITVKDLDGNLTPIKTVIIPSLNYIKEINSSNFKICLNEPQNVMFIDNDNLVYYRYVNKNTTIYTFTADVYETSIQAQFFATCWQNPIIVIKDLQTGKILFSYSGSSFSKFVYFPLGQYVIQIINNDGKGIIYGLWDGQTNLVINVFSCPQISYNQLIDNTTVINNTVNFNIRYNNPFLLYIYSKNQTLKIDCYEFCMLSLTFNSSPVCYKIVDLQNNLLKTKCLFLSTSQNGFNNNNPLFLFFIAGVFVLAVSSIASRNIVVTLIFCALIVILTLSCLINPLLGVGGTIGIFILSVIYYILNKDNEG